MIKNVFTKSITFKNKTKASAIVSYTLSKEEIEERYGDIKPEKNKPKTSKHYSKALIWKLRRDANGIKESWNKPTFRKYA